MTVSVNAGDEIDDAHYIDLIQQLVTNYALVYGQPLNCARSRDSFINDFQFELIATDVQRFFYASHVGTYTFSQCRDIVFDNSSNFNDGNESGNSTYEVFGSLVRHEDVNQAQQGITDAINNGVPSYTSLPYFTYGAIARGDVMNDVDFSYIKCPISFDWDNDDAGDNTNRPYTVTLNTTGSTTDITGNDQSQIRYFSQCGGRIQLYAEGTNSDGTSRSEDVKNMLAQINRVRNPWPLSNITLTTSWDQADVIQTVNSTEYTDNKIELLQRRDSNNVIYYALRFTDAANASNGGAENLYDEGFTTDITLYGRVYFPGHQQNNWRPKGSLA